jgi:hypothetical protein
MMPCPYGEVPILLTYNSNHINTDGRFLPYFNLFGLSH